jgi:hypothetical protein
MSATASAVMCGWADTARRTASRCAVIWMPRCRRTSAGLEATADEYIKALSRSKLVILGPVPYQDKDPHRTGIGSRFPVGNLVLSDAVQALIENDPVASMTLNTCLRFHQNGQWGDVTPEDARANEAALVDGGEIVSSYQLQGRPVWVITDAERATTRVMLIDEADTAAG